MINRFAVLSHWKMLIKVHGKKCKIHTGLIHTQHCRKQDGHGVKYKMDCTQKIYVVIKE